MKSKLWWVVAICFLGILAVSGCALPPQKRPGGEPRPVPVTDKPVWVQLGSGAFSTLDHGDAFHGVGSASGLQNKALLRATADNAARREVEQVLTRFVRQMAGSNAQSEVAGYLPLVQTSMQSAAIKEHWTDQAENKFYALCRVDLNAFKQALARFGGLEMSQRNAMLGRADQLFARMAAPPLAR